MLTLGFKNSKSDSSLFVYLLHNIRLYVLIITASDDNALEKFITALAAQFSLKDLGDLSCFLGVKVLRNHQGLVLNQRQYILDISTKANMHEAKSVPTPLTVDPPITKEAIPYSNPTEYRGLIGSLQYLGLTRPDIAFAVNKLAQYMQSPTDDH